MSSVVEPRTCVKCKTPYRTKLKKGGKQDARACPQCGHDNSRK
jgi:DNA-directed RNA polymerase subunit RPC12/RpoP